MPNPSPDQFLERWSGVKDNNFERTIQETFGLSEHDETIYKAEGFSMSLSQIQEQLDSAKFKYHYRSHGQSIQIPDADITAYTSTFSSTTDTAKALKSFAANAKKGSPRESVAHYLQSKRLLKDSLKVPKLKKMQLNPYYDIWAWSCHETCFLGPLNDEAYSDPVSAKMTHPMLPVLFHHFGCACPSYEALSLISQVIKAGAHNGVLEVGSGNGYWTFLLRKLGVSVIAVDNMDASWRTMWIGDTVKANGMEWLKQNGGAKDKLLLMVYPIVAGDFMDKVVSSYKGETIVIAGTQNANRFTGFRDRTIEEYFQTEKKEYEMTVRVALPSFAGKDEALYIFQRKSSNTYQIY